MSTKPTILVNQITKATIVWRPLILSVFHSGRRRGDS